MPYCPNCAHELELAASKCNRCAADFGENSLWKPLAVSPRLKAQRPIIERTPIQRFWMRLGGSIWLILVVALSVGVMLVFGMLSLPIGGLSNAQFQLPVFLALTHASAALFALVQLWCKEPFTLFFLVVSVLPFFATFIYPMAAILSMK